MHCFSLYLFQHTAARRRLGKPSRLSAHHTLFQHTAARRRLVRAFTPVAPLIRFQHTAARRRLASITACPYLISDVSTHSRPKAAGFATITLIRVARGSFNTQPPEGGWETEIFVMFGRFVSTHSRPKAAGPSARFRAYARPFQHTAARRRLELEIPAYLFGKGFQHTAARRRLGVPTLYSCLNDRFQHTAARRRLAFAFENGVLLTKFQHTAARRRLVIE